MYKMLSCHFGPVSNLGQVPAKACNRVVIFTLTAVSPAAVCTPKILLLVKFGNYLDWCKVNTPFGFDLMNIQ